MCVLIEKILDVVLKRFNHTRYGNFRLMRAWVMSVTEVVIETMAGCRMAFMSPSGSAESHAHPYRQTVKAVHQANSKRQIANLFRAKMVE